MTSPFTIFLDIRKMSRRRIVLTVIWVAYFIVTLAWSLYELVKTDFEIHMLSFLAYALGNTILGGVSWHMWLKER